MPEITVVGGGLAGLIAATEVAEAGVPVRVLEARSRLGGRAGSAPPPYVANLGPHALYAGTALWRWLKERQLHRPAPAPRSLAIAFRWRGEVRRRPPRAALAFLRLIGVDAPVDVDLRSWATERYGSDGAQALAGIAAPLTFDHDPGRLSAAFVVERIRRIFLRPRLTARYVEGGWSALVERLAAYAASIGVRIETNAPVDGLGDIGSDPTILAIEPAAARRLLDDDTLRVESPRVALLDVAFERRRRDPYVVVDLDDVSFFTRATAVVPSLAPEGQELVQASAGLRPGEDAAAGHARLEAVLDGAFPGWRDRLVWRRVARVQEATGALDLPGFTWRDRPGVSYRDGVWLAGDWVAAPGHLAEVSCNAAVEAARAAVAHTRRPVLDRATTR